jgi:hypothetical protein
MSSLIMHNMTHNMRANHIISFVITEEIRKYETLLQNEEFIDIRGLNV